MSLASCSCRYSAHEEIGPEVYSAAWHREHLAAHVAASPGLDARSVQVLTELAEAAERRESTS